MFHRLSVIFAFLASFLPLAANAAHYSEVTAEYHALAWQIGMQEPGVDAARLAPYHILFVPGLATDTTEAVGELTGRLGLTPTDGFLAAFHQQMSWLEENGIEFSMTPLNRLGSCDENGDLIFDSINRLAKPVILVTQSKGGVDAMHALVKHPSLWTKVAAWVAYQPPHAGSVLADIVQQNRALAGPSSLILKLLKGTSLTYRDMTSASRAEFNRRNRAAIETIPLVFPVVTLETTEEPASIQDYLFGDKSKVAFLGPFVSVISDRGGGINDGIASLAGTCIKYSACVHIDGIDHFAAVMNTSPFKSIPRGTRIAMFRALLDMAVTRAGGR